MTSTPLNSASVAASIVQRQRHCDGCVVLSRRRSFHTEGRHVHCQRIRTNAALQDREQHFRDERGVAAAPLSAIVTCGGSAHRALCLHRARRACDRDNAQRPPAPLSVMVLIAAVSRLIASAALPASATLTATDSDNNSAAAAAAVAHAGVAVTAERASAAPAAVGDGNQNQRAGCRPWRRCRRCSTSRRYPPSAPLPLSATGTPAAMLPGMPLPGPGIADGPAPIFPGASTPAPLSPMPRMASSCANTSAAVPLSLVAIAGRRANASLPALMSASARPTDTRPVRLRPAPASVTLICGRRRPDLPAAHVAQ